MYNEINEIKKTLEERKRTEYLNKLNQLANQFNETDFDEFLKWYDGIEERVLDIALEDKFDCGAMVDYFITYEDMLGEHITAEEFHELEDVLYNNSDLPYITDPMNQTKKMKELYRDRLAEVRTKRRKDSQYESKEL